MKKRTIILIAAAIAVVIAGSVGAVVWKRRTLPIQNNSNTDTSQIQESSTQETLPAEQIESFQAVIDQTIKPEETQEEAPLFLESLRDAYSLEIVSIYPLEAKDTYQGTVRLTYADAADAIKTYMNENSNVPFDEEKLNRDIAELVSNAELVTEECEMYFVKNGEELQPVFTEEMIDKMYGGIYSAYYEKLDEFVASMKEGE